MGTSPAADPKSRSVLEFPLLGDAQDDDIVYLLRGTGVTRDRRIRVGDLRKNFTANGARTLKVYTADAVRNTLTVNIDGVSSISVELLGTRAADLDVTFTGTIPEGCHLFFLNQASCQARLLGTVGTFRALRPWDAAYLVMQDSTLQGVGIMTGANVESLVTAAVYTEQSRASVTEAALQNAIGAEVGRAQGAEGGLQSQIDAIHPTVMSGMVIPQTIVIRVDSDVNSESTWVSSPGYTGSVTTTKQKILNGSDSILVPDVASIWNPESDAKMPWGWTTGEIPVDGAKSLADSKAFVTTGGSVTDRCTVIDWVKTLGKIALISGRTDGAAHTHLHLLLPSPRIDKFEELIIEIAHQNNLGDLTKVVSADIGVSAGESPANAWIGSVTVSAYSAIFLRARHEARADWKMDAWALPWELRA